jgi:hypothetical protein
MVPCAPCTHNPMMLWLSVAFIEYTEYNTPEPQTPQDAPWLRGPSLKVYS